MAARNELTKKLKAWYETRELANAPMGDIDDGVEKRYGAACEDLAAFLRDRPTLRGGVM